MLKIMQKSMKKDYLCPLQCYERATQAILPVISLLNLPKLRFSVVQNFDHAYSLYWSDLFPVWAGHGRGRNYSASVPYCGMATMRVCEARFQFKCPRMNTKGSNVLSVHEQ